jgi:hypothetical protein
MPDPLDELLESLSDALELAPSVARPYVRKGG